MPTVTLSFAFHAYARAAYGYGSIRYWIAPVNPKGTT
jgi:hypothetical protein